MFKRSAIVILIFCVSAALYAYPTTVKETVDLGISQSTGGLTISDNNRYLFVGYTDVLKRVDLGTLALTTDQPPALTTDDGTEGNLKGIGYSPARNQIYAAQDNGQMLAFSYDTITAIPTVTDIVDNRSLGPLEIDTSTTPNTIYIGNSTDGLIYVLTAGSSTIDRTIQLKSGSEAGTTFTINDIHYVGATDELYASTNIGWIYYVPSGSSAGQTIIVDITKAANLVALDSNDSGTKLYAVDSSSNNRINVISTSSRTVTNTIDVSTQDNTGFVDITVMGVDSPAGSFYGFVSGQKGVTVFNTFNDTLIDVNNSNDNPVKHYDPISTTHYGSLITGTDHYLYMSAAGGDILVMTDRPGITISSVKYYDSTGAAATALQIGGTVELTFQSDIAGTYTVRANGSIDASGGLLTDVTGATSGSVTADTDKTLTFAYDTNKTLLSEGANIFFFFVVDSSSLTGRRGATVTVDTPPDQIVIRSTGFGNGRVYVTFDRLTASDMDHYNVYVDTDPATVITKTDVSLVITQPSSGSTVTGEVGSLTNGATYYIAVEGVDAAGNVGARGYLLPDGSEASAMPEVTVGPAGRSGETGGCSLVR